MLTEASQQSDTKNLEFFVRVYFTIYPCHQINGRQALKETNNQRYKKNMEEFKDYLEQQGAKYSKSEEILPYFALPYIPNLPEHPAFKSLFTIKWLNSLKERLGVCFGKEKNPNPSILELMYEKYIDPEKPGTSINDKQLLSKIHSLENQLAIANEENYKLQEKLQNFEKDFEDYSTDLLQIGKNLFSMLESARSGKTVTENMIAQAHSWLIKYDKSIVLSLPANMPSASLNYASIIKDLTSVQDDLQICALLQALR